MTVEVARGAAVPRRISVLGATGSIGESTLDLIGRDASSYRVVALTGGHNAARLAELAVLHRAELAVLADPNGYAALRDALAGLTMPVAVAWGALDPVLPFHQTNDLPPLFALHRLPGAGHMLIEEAPDLVTELIRRQLR